MLINCPYCERPILILEVNCGIFRCGIYKESWNQLPPHSSKEECERALFEGLIFGCGGPFQVRADDKGEPVVEKCDYI